MPVARAAHAQDAAPSFAPGDVLVVRSTDPLSPIDIPLAMTQDGHTLFEQSRDDAVVHLPDTSRRMMRSASSRSSGVLTLKNGSMGARGHSTFAT